MCSCIIDKTYSNYSKKILDHSKVLIPCLIFEKKNIRFQTFQILFFKNQVRDRESRLQSANTATAPNPGTRSFMSLKFCRHWTRRIYIIKIKAWKVSSLKIQCQKNVPSELKRTKLQTTLTWSPCCFEYYFHWS